ncbi:MAG TPA: response regulator [Pyrinomonadaceae bacterium]|nr:response regulator [Pyrinomonadaceae bacterium]
MVRVKRSRREIHRRTHALWCVVRREIGRNSFPLILLSDNHVGSRSQLESLLVARDCRVICAKDSPETLNLLHRFYFDLIIYDVDLPAIGGVTLLRHVKLHLPDTEVLLVTERAQLGLTSLAMQHGAVDCLVKPLGQSAIDALIQHARMAAGRNHGPNI